MNDSTIVRGSLTMELNDGSTRQIDINGQFAVFESTIGPDYTSFELNDVRKADVIETHTQGPLQAGDFVVVGSAAQSPRRLIRQVTTTDKMTIDGTQPIYYDDSAGPAWHLESLSGVHGWNYASNLTKVNVKVENKWTVIAD